jgi:hypothetical protein
MDKSKEIGQIESERAIEETKQKMSKWKKER